MNVHILLHANSWITLNKYIFNLLFFNFKRTIGNCFSFACMIYIIQLTHYWKNHWNEPQKQSYPDNYQTPTATFGAANKDRKTKLTQNTNLVHTKYTGVWMHDHSVYRAGHDSRLHILICTQTDCYWSGTQIGPFRMPGTCNQQSWMHNPAWCLTNIDLPINKL